jgi:two-component system response regulator PilR (NtrC family)
LRERREDITTLVDFILDRLAREAQATKPFISEAALKGFMAYQFPGNVRELENILERAMTLCEGGRIEFDDLHCRESRLRRRLPSRVKILR